MSERGPDQIIATGGSTKPAEKVVNVDRVQIVRLMTGQEIIADLTENEDGTVTLLHPMLIAITPTPNGKVDLQLRPFMPFAKKDDVVLSKKFVEDMFVCTYVPFDQITEKYRSAFSNIILPSQGLTTPSGVITE